MGTHVSQEHQKRTLNSLRSIVQALRVSSRASEKALGMSAAQLFVLQQIAAAGKCSISALATRTLTHPSSVSVVVTRLVEQGLAERHDAAGDRRRAEVSCTPSGHERLADAPPLVQDRLIGALSVMDPTVLASLSHGLELLVACIGESGNPVRMFFDEDEERPASPPTPLDVRDP
jgi:DNA-binding MarR family transcriptional regulator